MTPKSSAYAAPPHARIKPSPSATPLPGSVRPVAAPAPAPAPAAPAAKTKVRKTGLARVAELLPRTVFGMLHAFALLTVVGAVAGYDVAVPDATALGLFFGFFVLRTFGLTAGFHRYFAHRGYQTSRWFQFCLAWFGTMATQNGPMWWAGHHRRHHRHSDEEGDPHSPIVGTIWHAHVGWILDDETANPAEPEMKDWRKYPELWWLDRNDWLPPTLLAALCYAVGGPTGLLWGFVVGTVCLYHTTFCVNSACHLLGSRRFATTDRSRNNAVVAVLTMGEGWHNNHHHYPSAARQGFMWYEFDASYAILKGLSWFGVVWGLRQPTERALAKDRIGR